MAATTTKPETTTSAAPLEYWRESARPLAGLAFVVPLIVAYEGGLIWLGSEAVRNGADVWLRGFLGHAGFGQYFLLPVLTCGVLLGWHHASRNPWRVDPRVLGGMVVECVAIGLLLLLVAQAQQHAFQWLAGEFPARYAAASAQAAAGKEMASLVAYCGAGIYEELLFRVLLLPLAVGLIRAAGLSQMKSVIAAIVATSLLFSLAHYKLILPYGDPFDWFSFVFRFSAGVVFCVLLWFRGFGIAAGGHTVYDVLAWLA
jgi:membrane protease YdiL (CAAX protease family)